VLSLFLINKYNKMGLRNMKSVDLGTFSTNTQSVMSSSADFRTATFTLITTWFTGTIKFFASNADNVWTAPDLSSTANTSNEYSTVRSIDLNDGTAIDGDIWITSTIETAVRRFEINDNNNNWVGIKTSSVTAWSIQVKLDLVDNQ